ncbi:MAG TPA: hypothetical protein VLC53_03150 [Myxococcota bacterium]|nr:hypothetical protein [Myxococcota bacterium]
MIDPVGLPVSDYERSRRLFAAALPPLGYGAFVLAPDGNDVEALCHAAV